LFDPIGRFVDYLCQLSGTVSLKNRQQRGNVEIGTALFGTNVDFLVVSQGDIVFTALVGTTVETVSALFGTSGWPSFILLAVLPTTALVGTTVENFSCDRTSWNTHPHVLEQCHRTSWNGNPAYSGSTISFPRSHNIGTSV
jgi:hypothetical protein